MGVCVLQYTAGYMVNNVIYNMGYSIVYGTLTICGMWWSRPGEDFDPKCTI